MCILANDQKLKLMVQMNGVDIECLIDTGANANILC
jgi:predicted aspartyl protease